LIPELGQIALLLALAAALLQSLPPLLGALRGRPDWMALARPAAGLQSAAVIIAFALLTASFVRNDFSVLYVAQNSNSALPLVYRIAGVWGGHEGSLLMWLLMLCLWTLAVARFSRGLPEVFITRVLAVMGLISAGFLLFMLLTSNPFERLLPAAFDGRDLNPLLQDPGMVGHPPTLYMGYVGFSVAFAFAVSALIGGELDATWARWTRPWTTAAWIFLTLGIAMGSLWAYYELGWGGWWFWDPVENASFMPWLAGTALIHSLAVTEKRNGFRAWTVLLAILAFSLSLMGTFLVRSGVLSSVHAFATDPRRGLFILAFLVLVIGSSLTLFAWRAAKVGLGQRFAVVSRESTLLANNLLLVVTTGAVLLGTLYPLFLDALGLGKISVGPPYFDQIFALLMTPLVVLMGLGPLMRWKGDTVPALAQRLRWAALASVLATAASTVSAGLFSPWAVIGQALAWWILWTVGADLAAWRGQFARIPRATLGMWLAHLGVAAFIAGVTVVKSAERETDVKMRPGDTTTLAGWQFRLDRIGPVPGPNYEAMRAELTATRDGHAPVHLAPEKRIYRVQTNPMTEAAIDPGLTRDLYVSLGEPLPDGAWTFRVQMKPLVDWIWGGCVLMALGGLLAATDRRYRRR